MNPIGVDGCRAGWLCAIADEDPHHLRFEVVANVTPLVAFAGQGDAIIAIDIPIGLGGTLPRPVDLAARELLGPKQGSRVFPAPSRAALGGHSYAECCALNKQARGVSLSQQSYAILAKIRQVDEAMTPALQARVREMHPEVTFCVLNGARLQHQKRTVEGQHERLAILEKHGVTFAPDAERRQLGRGAVQVDDLVDAAVGVLTAKRIREQTCQIIGDGACDARGLRMEMIV